MGVSKRRSLGREIDHSSKLYGVRNRLYLNSLSLRIDFMQIAIKDLFEVVRKKHGILAQEMAIARVFARLICVVEYFRSQHYYLPFVDTLCKKYPANGCSYCKQKPCTCLTSSRFESELNDSSLSDQSKWSIHDWQEHLKVVYGDKNCEQTWDNILNRLLTEVTEISNVFLLTHQSNQGELIDGYAKEAADAFAWICALATRLNLSLDVANEKAYGKHCWSCKTNPCECDGFRFDFVDWKEFEEKSFADTPGSVLK